MIFQQIVQSIDNPFSVNEILEICKEEEEKKLTFNISADCAKHRKPLLSELNFRNMQKKKTNLENFSGLRRAWTFPSQWTRSSRHPWRSSMICWAGACIIISSNIYPHIVNLTPIMIMKILTNNYNTITIVNEND